MSSRRPRLQQRRWLVRPASAFSRASSRAIAGAGRWFWRCRELRLRLRRVLLHAEEPAPPPRIRNRCGEAGVRVSHHGETECAETVVLRFEFWSADFGHLTVEDHRFAQANGFPFKREATLSKILRQPRLTKNGPSRKSMAEVPGRIASWNCSRDQRTAQCRLCSLEEQLASSRSGSWNSPRGN